MSKNYYAILGVPHNATARQVRQRFLTLAREWHPDKFQGDEKAFFNHAMALGKSPPE